MTIALRVLSPGAHTTLQDGGRELWLRFGVAPSGALDPRALAAANLLVGNPPLCGALEMTLTGGSFAAEGGGARIALAGAAMRMTIDGAAIASDRSHTLAAGAVLRIGGARGGARAYLAVSGGFAAVPVFGSVATHTRSGIGGFAGRVLQEGDVLKLAAVPPTGPERRLVAEPPPTHTHLRIVLGPQDDYFTAAAIERLRDGEFTISPRSDRMGLQLAGPALTHARGFNVISDGIAAGSIQVPGGGQPIILLADRQTTGGYPKIATVISADLPGLGQMRPGDRLRFVAVGLDEARTARRKLMAWLDALPQRIVAVSDEFDSERLLGANLISGVTDGDG